MTRCWPRWSRCALKMDALPLKSEAEEAVNPWNVRETLLDTGRKAALSRRWETALALNAEVVKVKQARGADALEVARTRFNDYGPLLLWAATTTPAPC